MALSSLRIARVPENFSELKIHKFCIVGRRISDKILAYLLHLHENRIQFRLIKPWLDKSESAFYSVICPRGVMCSKHFPVFYSLSLLTFFHPNLYLLSCCSLKGFSVSLPFQQQVTLGVALRTHVQISSSSPSASILLTSPLGFLLLLRKFMTIQKLPLLGNYSFP